MREPITFTVPCVPVAQPRQRHRIIQAHGRTFAQNYTPANSPVNAFKAACQLAATQAFTGAPLDEPLFAKLVFVMPRGSKPGWIKRDSSWSAAWKAGSRVPYSSPRNDRDNLMKSVQDALNGLLYRDDGLLCAGPVEKWIASQHEQPHCEITIQPLEDVA